MQVSYICLVGSKSGSELEILVIAEALKTWQSSQVFPTHWDQGDRGEITERC